MSTESNPTRCFSLIELKFDLQGRITNWDDVRDYYLLNVSVFRELYRQIYCLPAYKNSPDKDKIMINFLLEYIIKLQKEFTSFAAQSTRPIIPIKKDEKNSL
jgi:hypothetical protein